MVDLLASWVQLAPSGLLDAPPHLDSLNQLVADRGITTGNGQPLRFVVPGGSTLGYEERAWVTGEIETRENNWHDAFNALAWLLYPQAKRALNRRHHQALVAQRAAGSPARGRLRDALTQFDECGLVIACADMSLWEGLRTHRWREVFSDRRTAVETCLRFFVFGHASLDSLRAPFVGLTAKALCYPVTPAWLGQTVVAQLNDTDAWLAGKIAGTDDDFARSFQPIPLLGIPGVTPESENPAYYDDTRQFRPARPARQTSQ